MTDLSRRKFMAAGTTLGALGLASPALAKSFGHPDTPPQGLAATQGHPAGLKNIGPQNPDLAAQFPDAVTPPPTDVGDMPLFWASFNNAPRRILEGGWARQVTQADFQISTTISGVNMRLGPGAIRELHWHQAAEWAFVSNGSIRVTTIDPDGRAYVGDAHAGDLWYFPAGYPHSLQGIGADGGEFILAFDNGEQTEYNTLHASDWLAHTPPEILALNFGVSPDQLSTIPLHNKYIFPGRAPKDLAAEQKAVHGAAGAPPNPFVYRLASGPVASQTRGGKVQIADSSNFKALKPNSAGLEAEHPGVSAALVTVHPGGLRAMHWHPNADEWQYYIQGTAQMTVFNTGPKAVTNDFAPGDIGYIPQNLGHYIVNTGKTDLVFLEIFKASDYRSVSLSDWLAHTPSQMVEDTYNLSADVVSKFPAGNHPVVPV